jgi:hypothetical protein
MFDLDPINERRKTLRRQRQPHGAAPAISCLEA